MTIRFRGCASGLSLAVEMKINQGWHRASERGVAAIFPKAVFNAESKSLVLNGVPSEFDSSGIRRSSAKPFTLTPTGIFSITELANECPFTNTSWHAAPG